MDFQLIYLQYILSMSLLRSFFNYFKSIIYKHSAPMGLGCFFVSFNSVVYCRDTILHELITVLTMTVDAFIGKIINLTTSEVPPPT